MKLLLSCMATMILICAILMVVPSALPLKGDLTHEVMGM